MSIKLAQPHGFIKLDLGWRGGFRKVEMTGGPFDLFKVQPGNFGVAVRAERISRGQCHIHLPIKDFSVPERTAAVEDALIVTFKAALDGKDVYVGCAGGFGRTGLFLALAAKVAGAADPVQFVRETYNPHAVETRAQEAYVETFDISRARKEVNRAAWRSRLPKAFR